jgi:Fur family peroxide stress response transcriptional regulator
MAGMDVRLTPQRRAVLDVPHAAHDHPTAAEVYERVRLNAPGIGAATVYRTLGMLVRHGQALELSLTGQPSRYDANTERHDHLVCDSCGRAVDVQATLPSESLAAVAAGAGFTMTGVDLRIRGLCASC